MFKLHLTRQQQRLYEIMIQEIIPQYPQDQQAGLVDAANAWRLPYWDWAVTNALPDIATKPTFTVNRFDGQTVDIANPLYKFTMPGGKNMGTGGVQSISAGNEVLPVRRLPGCLTLRSAQSHLPF
jgi:Common central domain of tyrosinase